MTTKNTIRLSLRPEGTFLVAWAEVPELEEEPIRLGSIAIGLLAGTAGNRRKETFRLLMQDIIEETLSAAGVAEGTWSEPEPAPECDQVDPA